MLSDARRLYIEEVLGTSVAAYRPAPRAGGEAVQPAPILRTIVVLTPPLGDAARALLTKILGSVRLTDFTHVEGDEPVAAAHVLHFGPGAIAGRSTTAHGTCWGFHDLERLVTGEAQDVTQLKREVWTLLQAFAREVPCCNS